MVSPAFDLAPLITNQLPRIFKFHFPLFLARKSGNLTRGNQLQLSGFVEAFFGWDGDSYPHAFTEPKFASKHGSAEAVRDRDWRKRETSPPQTQCKCVCVCVCGG